MNCDADSADRLGFIPRGKHRTLIGVCFEERNYYSWGVLRLRLSHDRVVVRARLPRGVGRFRTHANAQTNHVQMPSEQTPATRSAP